MNCHACTAAQTHLLPLEFQGLDQVADGPSGIQGPQHALQLSSCAHGVKGSASPRATPCACARSGHSLGPRSMRARTFSRDVVLEYPNAQQVALPVEGRHIAGTDVDGFFRDKGNLQDGVHVGFIATTSSITVGRAPRTVTPGAPAPRHAQACSQRRQSSSPAPNRSQASHKSRILAGTSCTGLCQMMIFDVATGAGRAEGRA